MMGRVSEGTSLLAPKRRMPSLRLGLAVGGLVACAALFVSSRGVPYDDAAALDASAALTSDIRRVYYINCADDTERAASIEAQLDAHLPSVARERVECVSAADFISGDARVPSGIDVTHLFNVSNSTEKAWTSLAIYLSHKAVTKKIAEQPKDDGGLYLVLEDDAVFVDGFARKFAAMRPSWPETFDLIRLGCWQYEVEADRQPGGTLFAAAKPTDAAHRHVGPSNGTIYLGNHAGLFTVPGAQTQLDIFNREGWGYTDALARTANLDSFASFCVACESTLVSTDESLPQDHDPEGDHTESRTCVPSVPGR